MSEYDLDVQYRPGKKNANADALSRSPLQDAVCDDSEVISAVTDTSGPSPQPEAPDENTNEAKMRTEQREDPELALVIKFLEDGDLPADDKEARKLLLRREDFELLDRTLYYIDRKRSIRRLVVPKKLRSDLLKETHSARFGGHFAEQSTHATLSKTYWWDGMYADIVAHCRSCLTCAARTGGGRHPPTPLQPIPVSGAFDLMAVDVMQLPTTENGNQYVVVFSEYLTKWIEVFAVPNQRAETIARLFVEQVICRYGIPNRLLVRVSIRRKFRR